MPASFICDHCGQEHEGLPQDWAFLLPDEVHALGYIGRYLRCRHNDDLCTLDEARFFLRAVLPIPLLEGAPGESFHWGIWVEVDRRVHDLYARSWAEDISGEPRAMGRLANEIAVHEGSAGLQVEIEFPPGTQRPRLQLLPAIRHSLATEQRHGITGKRHHDILAALGHFGDEGDQ